MKLKEDLIKFEKENKLARLDEDFIPDFIEVFGGETKDFVDLLNRKSRGKFAEGFSYRTLNHWESLGIIPNDRTEEKIWRKYSLLDQVWLNIVIALRNFDASLDLAKRIKNYLSRFEEHTGSDYPLLTYFYAFSVSNNDTEFFLIITEEENFQLATKRDLLNMFIEASPIPNVILINVLDIFNKVTKTQLENNKINEEEWRVISGLDVKIHSAINDERNNRTTVIKNKSGQPSMLEMERIINSTQKAVDGLKDIEYGAQTIKKQNGKIVSQVQTIKQKL